MAMIENAERFHWHGFAKFLIPINDPRCPICNSNGQLSAPGATCDCGHKRSWHAFGARCVRCNCAQFKDGSRIKAANL